MGAFFTNLQIRNNATAVVCRAIDRLTGSRAYVSPAKRGWVTVYVAATENQRQETLCTLAHGASKLLQTEVFGFMVHDSDVAMYWLYRGGELVDEFNSEPDYFGHSVDADTRLRVHGNVAELQPLCLGGTTSERIEGVLHPADGPPPMAEEIVADLSMLLGMDPTRATLGFTYFDTEGEEVLPDAAEFEPVGAGLARKRSYQSRAIDVPAAPAMDPFLPAINMLTQMWSDQYEQQLKLLAGKLDSKDGEMLRQLCDGFDRSARNLLNLSKLPRVPEFEVLKAARDRGPEALSALVIETTPEQLTDVGIGAAISGLDGFLAALLRRGLNPKQVNAYGRTTLEAAGQHGENSRIYQVVKAFADKLP